MSNRNKTYYKNGIVSTSSHPILLKGQVVQILAEESTFYIVRLNINSNIIKIEKEYIITS